MHNDIEQLLLRVRQGDRQALEALLQGHQAQIYRFGLKMCGNPDDAKDILQETLLAMARGVGDDGRPQGAEFRGASSLSTWLYAIARSFCIKKRRRSKFAPTQEQSLDDVQAPVQVADQARTPLEALAAKEVEQVLEQAIASLETSSREVLLLRDVEGLSAAQVAEVLGISVQAVKSRLHRARLAVRAQVAPRLGLPETTTPANQTCPDVLTLFSQHLEDDISADTCAQMERHLAACPHCRGVCDSLKRTLALCRTQPAAVPEAVQASIKSALLNLRTTPKT